ncbi:unnamed protein product [Ophioblennius macclurei]
MAVAYDTVTQPGLLSQQYPPPLLPKPGKDNIRLQKLLKRTAKKKSSAQTSQSAAPFRSSLSPVNEASPDLERSDNSTPPKTPETPFILHSIQPAPRFTVRPLYQHVASPYPQRATYGRPASTSPLTVVAPSYTYTQDVATYSSVSLSVPISGISPVLGQVDQPMVPRISLPAFSQPEAAVAPAPILKKPALNTLSEPAAGLRPVTDGGSTQSKSKSPVPTPYSTAGGHSIIRPLTVLAPIVKSKSPRPTFKATEPSRSPKPMFDVPQIRMYTASTSYYETSRTPPVYDTAALTAIGNMVPQSKTPTKTKQDMTPTSEIERATTPTAQLSSFVTDSQRKTPTSEATTGTALKVETTVPALEIKSTTSTSDISRVTPTPDTKRATPTADTKRATPTADIKRATPTSEIKKPAPISVISVNEPTYEFETSRNKAGRPRTPARAATPAFEVSRPNPLLFAVTPISVEPEGTSPSQKVSAGSSLSPSQSVKITEPPAGILNGEIHSDEKSVSKAVEESIVRPKPESDLKRVDAPTSAPALAVTSVQRPKTPTYEASRLLSTAPGYKRPKTPTYGIPRSGVSPVATQRPKTPTQMTQRSSYRGLTPAEYAAYGGIKTYSPAFGIGSTTTPTQEDIKPKSDVSADCKTPSQIPSVTSSSTGEPSKTNEPSIDVGEPQQVKIAVIPTVVVSQASESPSITVTVETVSHQVAAQRETILTQETPKVMPPSAGSKTSVQQKTATSVKETIAKAPEAKDPLPKGGNQDPLKAVKKLLGKDKAQTTEQKPKKESKSEEPVTTVAATTTVPKDSGTSPVTPGLPVKAESPEGTENKGKDKKAEAASAATLEGDKPLPAAEPLLKVLQKPKGIKTKASGWSRLKKHMVVEQEEPKFPEADPQKEIGEQGKSEVKRQEDTPGETAGAQDDRQSSGSPKAVKMWDAVLFQMFSSKENIMHQIELNKSETEQSEEIATDESKEIPSFAFRLPVLLFSPKFDAKKLREAASRPVTKFSTVFEMGLIGRKGKEEEPKDFNRKARGFAAS